MIKSLKLKNFRQFKDFSLEFNKEIVIIQADNAKGKSTILEALHYITNQDSPFTSRVKEIFNQEQDKNKHFRIEIEKEFQDEVLNLAHYQEERKREYYKNKSKTTKKKVTESLASIIFSPEQIELLMLSPSRRRNFLDQIIKRIEPGYEEKLSTMKKILKQRNSYLKKLAKNFYNTGRIPNNDQQLDYWTKKFASHSTEIIIDRQKAIEELSSRKQKIVYRPSLDIGTLGDMVEFNDLLKFHIKKLEDNRKREIAISHTTIGAHRDDWSIHDGKDIQTFGSRGEKRVAIGRLILRSMEVIEKQLDYPTLLLLDDISSELDDHNTKEILEDAIRSSNQAIITTIREESIPKSILQEAQLIKI